MLTLRETLLRANDFQQQALQVNLEFEKIIKIAGITKILEQDPQKIINAAKEGKIPFVGENGALNILKLKKQLLELQNMFYDFSEFLEPIDLLPYLEQKEYRYVMTKARENNQDLASACRIGNIMFATILREIVPDKNRWSLMMYRIKAKWRKQNIKRVV
ncbi:hypothetical protein V6C27_04350 [Peptococcaceae bacterium 1198_IL3148]